MLRIFSSPPSQRHFRRASDVFLLVPAAIALVALTIAYPPSRFERSLTVFLASFPDWLDPIWTFFYDALALWAVGLVLAAVIGRRWFVVFQTASSVALAFVIAMGVARVALDRWPDLDDVVRLRVDESSYPVFQVAVTTAAILAISPQLVRPLQRTGRWLLLLGLVAAVLVEQAPPSASAAAFLVAVVAAATVRLAFGTSAGLPESADVVAALANLGIAVTRLEPVSRQPAGVFIARGSEAEGGALLVKVYGRDAYDTQLLAKAWRSLWYRGEGPRVRLSRLQAVEHEALVTLLARQKGVPTREVVVAGESSSADALLVFRDDTLAFELLPPEAIDDERLERSWRTLAILGGARIAHQRIDPGTLVAVGDDVGFADFDHATLAPRADQLLMDRAQLLATTSALVGSTRAVGAAIRTLGSDAVALLLPYLQPAAFGTPLRQALAGAGLETDDLRKETAALTGSAEPELLRLRRITWWSLVQVALLALAVSTVVGAATGLDYEELGTWLEDASWGWIAFGMIAAQLPRITQAISTLGSVPVQLPFVPVYGMQLATGYLNLALPSNFARMAINIRFFQRQGIAPTVAVTSGAIDSFASTVVQAILLALLVLFSSASLDLDLDLPSGPSVGSLVVVVCLALAVLAVLALVRRLRRVVTERVRRWWPEVREALRGLRAAHKLALLVGGSLATELLFATALGVFANAFGFDIGLADLLVINISVSLLASFIPIPGGIGVAEFGLTVGLVAAGMPEEAALATALVYRLATFYVPPVWGFFAMRWLQRNRYL